MSIGYTMLDAAGANGVGKAIFAKDFDNFLFSLDTDGGGDAALTVKFQGSIQETVPDFSAAASVTNQWTYIETVDYDTGLPVDGSTGISAVSADIHHTLEYNTNRLNWISAIVSGRTAGEVTVKVQLFTK